VAVTEIKYETMLRRSTSYTSVNALFE